MGGWRVENGEWTGQSACCTSLETERQTLLPASQLGAATGWKDGARGLTCVTCPSVVRPVDIQRERETGSHIGIMSLCRRWLN